MSIILLKNLSIIYIYKYLFKEIFCLLLIALLLSLSFKARSKGQKFFIDLLDNVIFELNLDIIL